MRTLFVVEMVLSPVVAGIAYLVPVAAHWGVFKYVPAVLWLLILIQCLVTFRWRGLWFLLGPPVASLAIVAFLVAAPPTPRRSAVAAGAADSADSAGAPMITHNADGTFTVRKEPPHGTGNQAQVSHGLVIPAQVVVPLVATPEKKH
jgi:hypothetical protein